MKNLLHRHKAIIIAMVSLVVMCGCAEKEIDTPIKQEDKLYFKQTIDGQEDEQLNSRAYTGDVKFETRGFTVAGYRTNGMFSVSNLNNLPFPNVFDIDNPGVDKSVIKIDIDNSETNINRKYWTKLPKFSLSSIYNISYFAWSSSEDNTITAATSSAGDKGYPWIEANVGAANTNQPDIVGALSMNHSNEYTVSAIDLDFKHLLSKMSFFVKTSNGMTANITKVECVYGASAVYSQARFTFDGTADVGLWSDHKTYLTTGAVTPNNWNNATTTGPSTLLGSMTLIPQSLTDNALSLKISYTTTQEGATSEPITRNVPLKAIDLKPGKNYVYTLDLNANEITFNVKVEGWIEMLGTDKGLPLVPGLMDPEVLLLLEGTDPPYTTADGSKYWLDRSGWNNHCQIMDRDQYNGVGAFDITHDATKRGYVFNRTAHLSGFLYNHIRIPYLGALTGNVGCEIVCHNLSGTTGWEWPTPLCISQGERTFGELSTFGRALLVHINEKNTNGWDYANQTDASVNASGERVTLTAPSGYNWNKLSFYGYGRINAVQSFGVIDNTNSASRTVPYDNTHYSLRHGMIGTVFNGIINYVKITNKSIDFEQMMNDYKILAKKYYIKTEQGAYVPPVKDGLLACWDARSGLLQGSSNGNGAYWMDQSGNNYFLKAVVPSGVNGSFAYDASRKAITSTTPIYPKSGIYMELNNGIEGRHSAITIETVSQSRTGYLNFFMVLYDKNGKRIAWIRPNTGLGNPTSYGLQVGSSIIDQDKGLYYHNYDPDTGTASQRRSLVYTIDLKTKISKIYLNGNLLNSQTFTNSDADFDIARIVLFNQNNGDGLNLMQAYDGYVHAFRIYDRELSSSEIQTNVRRDKTDFGF